jgi:hypothetical protein
MGSAELRVGDVVEVRSKDEILATLDESAQLDRLPFMPEMFAFCGKRFRVYKRAHKTCDTINEYRNRRMLSTVHLEGLRCDGAAHGGCQANCLLYWKEAWLKRIPTSETDTRPVDGRSTSEADVQAGTRRPGSDAYVCQATQVPAATEPQSEWKISQYIEDYTSGNVGLRRLAAGCFFVAYRGVVNSGIGLGPMLRWLYDAVQSLRHGAPYPLRPGRLPVGGTTPAEDLNLQPGEWVRVKSYDAILATCDITLKNRGMYFDKEMVPYCGRVYKVLRRVTRIINEKTGHMQQIKTPCIILDTVICESRYGECRLFCPRAIYPYWREIWLERVAVPGTASLEVGGALTTPAVTAPTRPAERASV